MSEKILIEVFSDYICPWCYLATPNIARLKQEPDLEIRLAGYPLHPNTPVTGRAATNVKEDDSVAQEKAARGREFQQQMQQLMDAEGLPYRPRKMIWNSRLAQELGAWAESIDRGDVLHAGLFHAYFVDNHNIHDIDILAGIAADAGLNAMAAREVLEQRSFSQQVDQQWERARDLGVTGVPSFVHDDLVVMGCQPIEVLMKFVNHLRGP